MRSVAADHARRAALEGRLETARLEQEKHLATYRYDPMAFIERLQVWNPWRVEFEPWRVWPHQEELVRAWVDVDGLQDGALRFRNVLLEKSRQMGDTVVCAGVFLWAVSHWDAPMLMQHQDLREVVDSGPTWDSFFGKVKTLAEHAPAGIGVPRLVVVGGNAPLIRVPGRPVRFVVGEGQTPDPGRGGRYAGALIDEAARIRYDTQSQAALRAACPEGRLMLSTPRGRGNTYYRIRETRPTGWDILRHHWSEHPDYGRGKHLAGADPSCRLCVGNAVGVKWTPENPAAHRFPGKLTSPWYDKQVLELTSEQVAEELDIDYTASLTARVYDDFDEQTHVLPDIPYDPNVPLEFSWDYGWDVTSVGVWQDRADVLCKIAEVEATEAVPEQVVADLLETLRRLGVREEELNPYITRQMLAVGDPAGEGTQLNTGRPLTTDYFAAGFTITNPGHQSVATTIKALTRLLLGRPKRVRYSRRGCPLTILHMQENRWPTNPQGERRVGSTKPLDDAHNHMCRADAYYATYKFPPPVEVENRPEDRSPETNGSYAFGGFGDATPGYGDPL